MIAIGVATIRVRALPTSTKITLLTLPLILTSLTATLTTMGRTTEAWLLSLFLFINVASVCTSEQNLEEQSREATT
jgi:hypothetical protein